MISSGLVSVTFRRLAPAKIVELAAQGGLDGIEWGGDIHVPPGDADRAVEVRKMTLQAGLRVAAYGSYYRAAESEGASFDAVLATARALGAPTIRVWSGIQSSAQASCSYRQRVAEDLHRIAAKAAEQHITVSCEFHDNTLTDTAPAALEILRLADHLNLRSYWQPRHGQPTETGLDELDQLSPWLSNVHVFHWWPTSADRLPLDAGVERWRRFLSRIKAMPGDRHALLEFTCNDDPGIFLRDAATLKKMLHDE